MLQQGRRAVGSAGSSSIDRSLTVGDAYTLAVEGITRKESYRRYRSPLASTCSNAFVRNVSRLGHRSMFTI